MFGKQRDSQSVIKSSSTLQENIVLLRENQTPILHGPPSITKFIYLIIFNPVPAFTGTKLFLRAPFWQTFYNFIYPYSFSPYFSIKTKQNNCMTKSLFPLSKIHFHSSYLLLLKTHILLSLRTDTIRLLSLVVLITYFNFNS